ncbi:DNA polymerase phi-domain-containing protein [Xylariaceae sp. FL0255]|nr:DNA polymerase phi-domain-containing protein [Xylariaceae sp. FL0255]
MGGKRKRGANKASVGLQPNQKRPKTDDSTADIPNSKTLELDKTPFPDENTGENRKREARVYELLGSWDNEERVTAAEALITGLVAGSEPALSRHLEKRLLRGLASSRNASRLGFSLALTELLRQLFGSLNLSGSKFPSLTFSKVLDALVEATQLGGNVPGQDERDCYFGRLFGLQCFVDAKILFDDESRWPQILDLLLQMAEKKVWMRPYCGWVIVESLPQMGQPIATSLLQKLHKIGLGKTAEGIGIWLRARSCYPTMKFPSKPWQDPLSPAAMPEVARVLKENVANDGGENTTALEMKQSDWNPQLHFVWDTIMSTIVELSSQDKKHAKQQFKLFWTTVVDDGLFSKSASDGQKFRGFKIFQKFLQGITTLDQSLVKELFTRNFLKCLINQASKEDRYLHRAAIKSLQSMEKAVETSPKLLVPILQELTGKHGLYDFDQRTSSKTVESLLQWVTRDNSEKILDLLREPILNLEDAPNEAEKLRQVYASYVYKMTIQAKTAPSDAGDAATRSALEIGIKELASCAYSSQVGFIPEISEKTREIFRKRLSSAFARVTKQQNHAEYLCDVVVSVKPTAVVMSEELEAERNAALKTMSRLLKTHHRTKKEKASSTSLGLALLYATTVFQLYEGEPDALGILQDLQSCSEKTSGKEEGSSELLVEILLALVSRQSSMTRQISEQVFELFTAEISREALELLTEPLLAEENERGYQTLFESLDDEDELMDDGPGSDSSSEDGGIDADELSEMGSDVEFVTLNGEDGAKLDAESDDDEADENVEETEDPDLVALDDALAKVLKSHRLDQDKDAISSDDDSDMTDSEMMGLDEKLVDVFKQRAKHTKGKNEKKDAKESVISFKHRVLDLLSIYVKNESSNALAFILVLPLLMLTRMSSVKPLANKAISILTDFSRASKKARSRDTPINPEGQFKLLKDIHQEASKDASHSFAKAASTASLMVASSLLAADRDYVDTINNLYAQTLTDCQKGNIKLQRTFFVDWVNWGMDHASNVSA